MPSFTAGPLRLPALPRRQAAPRPQPEQQQQPTQSGRAVVRSGRFAALIPGDGVVEQVFTSGLGNFL